MNQREEQRVIAALRASTGGLTVTEQDLITAGDRLRESLDPRPPRRRIALVAASVAAVLAVGFIVSQTAGRDPGTVPPAGTPTTSPADGLKAALDADVYSLPVATFTAGARPTMQDLTGFWLLRSPYDFPMIVDDNGDWAMGMPTERQGHGTSVLSEDILTRRISDRSGCARQSGLVGYSQPWRAALAPDGSLRLELTNNNVTCTPADVREVWDRVDAGSPIGDYLLAMAPDIEWQAPSERFTLQGLYVAPETGNVLEVTEDGRYRTYEPLADEPLVAADRGELGSAGTTVTGSCADGGFSGRLDVGRIPGVVGYFISREAIRITTTTDSCSAGIAEQGVWVKLLAF